MSLTRHYLSSSLYIINTNISKRYFAPPAKAAPGKIKDIKKSNTPTIIKRGTLNMSFISVFKDSKPPAILNDNEYPEWLWTIHNKLPTLEELLKKDFNSLNDEDKKRLFKLQRRNKIKETNKKSAL